MISAEQLEQACRKRDHLLKSKPNLDGFQNEINHLLSKTTCDGDRLEAIALVLHSKLKEINEIGFMELKKLLNDWNKPMA
ncbi:hypothetical protein DESC_690090 [Desulfosarcina cetonica]|nr:hypothetical protein DESC_690090 [Desulfosarcina cetonica]